MIVKSDTGTGKTHAFLFAILELIDPTVDQTQALILAPTRELAMQIQNFAREITTLDERITTEPCDWWYG
ncbi:DEAD/DEAH box helicase [Erysipelothrix sp. Poltava]|nr:DEAD/DEAH box helicase [Erysipelothrix sp. Poltava]